MTTQDQDMTAWIGHQVVDQAGDKVGKISNIYLDDQTGQPEWLAISTGLFGTKSSFVPVRGSAPDGDRIVISWDKETVKKAPQVEDEQDGYLTPEEEQTLYGYFDKQTLVGGTTQAAPVASGREDRSNEAGVVGHDTSGPTTDDAMTRSEEQVHVGTRTQEAGRARLRKYVVTEQVSQTVPVSHEEVRVEREAITDANRPAATDGPDISEEEHEVVLHEERPVVEKEVVPVERVRLSTETVTDEATVTEQVRKERIEQEGVETDQSV